MSIQEIPTALLSLCISYLDQQSHTKISLVNSEFLKSSWCPTSFEGNTFTLSTRIWKYLLCNSNVDIESLLFTFKLAKKLEIVPIQRLSATQTTKASFILKYISRIFTNLSYILIDDCYEACFLLHILPIFNKQYHVTLHLRMRPNLHNLDLDTINEWFQWYSPEIAHQIQLYLLANGNNNNLKHIIYENFDDFSDIYTTNIHIVSGLEKVSIINCDDFKFSSITCSNLAQKVKELELNPICISECLNEIKYFFQNNDILESLTLSADPYGFGKFTKLFMQEIHYDKMRDIINTTKLQNLNLIVDNNCNQNEDFFHLLNCFQETLDLKTLDIEWFWNKKMDSVYIIYMLSELVANALQRDIQISVKLKISKDETDSEELITETLYGMERFLIKINNKLISMESNCSENDNNNRYSNSLSKLTVDISSLGHGKRVDLYKQIMDDIIKYVFLV